MAARASTANSAPPVITPLTVPVKPAAKQAAPIKRDAKKSLKGVIVKKKTKPAAKVNTPSETKAVAPEKRTEPTEGDRPNVKRRKVEAVL